MAPKSKKAGEEPEAKKAKTEEEPKKEETPAEPKFQEPDDNKPAVNNKQIVFEAADTTLNVVPTVGGKVLASISESGMAFLLAGARANTAQKGGRYMFEAKVLQGTDPSYGQNKGCKMTLKIGFSTSATSLLMDDHCVYFDGEGYFNASKKKTNLKNAQFINKNTVAAVVLNLDSKSPNFNTVALYKDGVAMGEPMKLPENLHGKALFPHVVYRNASVHVNFGPTACKDLPFKCRMLQGATASDVEVQASKTPKDGKHEVVMPVAFPDEGTFDWLDEFMAKNPHHVELSDRKIVQWCHASGIFSKGSGKNNSNDKPACSFGIPQLDDMSVRKVISTLTPLMPRNYVIMEVKSNLIPAERKQILARFNYPCFKKVARVVMGEPNKTFKDLVQKKLLKDKQAKSDNTWKAKKAEANRKKQHEKMRKDADRKRKAAEKAKKAAIAEKKKKAEEERKAKAKEEGKEEEEKKEDETKEEPEEEKEEVEPEEPEDKDTEPPAVELTDEEKTQHFFKRQIPDISAVVMSHNYSKFATPSNDEGFDAIEYEWQKADKANEYLKKWVTDKKLTTRIEDIKPGQDFKDKVAEFKKLTKEWTDKLVAHKAAGKKKPAKKAGEEADDDVDIFSVTDINDVGGGVPLFENFAFEDWELMKLRCELCLLVKSFKTDCNDADRTGIPLDHVAFYYNRYFGDSIHVKRFGMESTTDLVALVKDSVQIKNGLVVSSVADDLDGLDIFLKLSEEGRRERQRRIDAGDETARLKIQPKPEPPKPVPKPAVEQKPAAAAVGGQGGLFVHQQELMKGKGKDMGKGKDQGKPGKDAAWGAPQWGAPQVVAATGKDFCKGGGGKDFGKGGGGKDQQKGGWGGKPQVMKGKW